MFKLDLQPGKRLCVQSCMTFYRTAVATVARRDQMGPPVASAARVTPECCSAVAASASAGSSSTVDPRRRAPPAQRKQNYRRKNRSAENLLNAQCDCQFFEDQVQLLRNTYPAAMPILSDLQVAAAQAESGRQFNIQIRVWENQ